MAQVVREQGATWQATPPKDSVIDTLKTFLLTSGRLHGKPLKTTVVAALDVANNWKLARLGKTLARLLNSRLIKGDFHMQALGAPFKIWSDGAITPIAEEIPELRRLNETDLEDRAGRLEILTDADYIKSFRAMWMKGKQGWGIARLKRKFNLEDFAFNRNLADMTVDLCPQTNWQGMSFQEALDRVLAIKSAILSEGVSVEERNLVQTDFLMVADEADFMLQMLRSFDTDLSWSTVTANRSMETVRELLMDPLLLPGFNDSGAHLTNMAFYDVNLRSLKLAATGGDADVSYMVKRLTKDAAEVFGVDGGSIYEGDIADLILVDPEKLAAYDPTLDLSARPAVIMVVGVNGVGKTTTIGKLAKFVTRAGRSVIIAAADTFRAAAVEQLTTWAQRAEVPIVVPDQGGQDPASVAYTAVEKALAEGIDIVIIDTAGRLHTKAGLMDELTKIRRVVEKLAPISEVLLVLDATTGQNGVLQADAFLQHAGVTGLVLSKTDGSAKGGFVLSVQKNTGIPIKLVGEGEGIDDMTGFSAPAFAAALTT